MHRDWRQEAVRLASHPPGRHDLRQMNYALASPGIGYFGIVLAALVLALAIVAATFPLLRRITGPETARNE